MPDLDDHQGDGAGQAEPKEPRALDPNDPLDRIAMEAVGDEQAADQAAEDFINPPEENPIDPAQTWAQIPYMLGKLAAMAMPELGPVYNEQACLQWGIGMAAVSEKYGWDAGETISKWGPEVALIVATVPLAVPTYHAVKKRMDEQKKAKAEVRFNANVKDLNDPPAPPESSNPMHQPPGNFSEPI